LEQRCLLSTYTVTDLANLGGGSAVAYGLDQAGQVVGYSTTPAAHGDAALWENGTVVDLGVLGRAEGGVATAINDAGQVVGWSGNHAFLWQDGVMIDLGTLPNAGEFSFTIARSINNAGQIVGTSGADAFLWQAGVMTDLGAIAGSPYTEASHINDAGQVAGLESVNSGQQAILWENGGVTELGALPGDPESAAVGLNNLGHAVGWSGVTGDDPMLRAVLFQDGTVTELAPLGSIALSINDADQVVGAMPAFGGPTRNHAFLYADGVLADLNSLIPADSGIILESAAAINNAGQIVGAGYDLEGRTLHAFLLTPDSGGNAPAPGGANFASRTPQESDLAQAAVLLSPPVDPASLVAPSPSAADPRAAIVPTDPGQQIPLGQPTRSEGTVAAWTASRERPTPEAIVETREGAGLAGLEVDG
jgi:probable HAF family extracellular repeat protein